MWFDSLLRANKSPRQHSGRRQPKPARRRLRLTLEQLESRTVLSAYSAASAADLIADINAANTARGANTITLATPTTSPYLLTAVDNTTDGAAGLPVIAAGDSLTIAGDGDAIERSSAAGTPAFRLFDVAAGASLTLGNLTLEGGLAQGSGVSAEGGGIYNQGTLTLNGVTVENSIAHGASATPMRPGWDAAGGGIYSSGVLTLEGGTKVQDNAAVGGLAGPVPISGTPPAHGGNAWGGGLYVAGGTASLAGDTLSSNTSQGGLGRPGNSVWSNGGAGGNGFGGGLEVAGGTVVVSNDSLPSNAALGGEGGNAYQSGVGGAAGNAFGGAIGVSGGTVSVTSSTLVSNIAQGGAGGSGVSSGYPFYPQGGAGGNGFGGALQVNGGSVAVSNDSLTSNLAQGGNATGCYPVALGDGFGGAVQVAAGGAVTFSSDTVSSNNAQGGERIFLGSVLAHGLGEGGGIYIAAAATVEIDALTLKNVVHNTASTSSPNIFGTYIET